MGRLVQTHTSYYKHRQQPIMNVLSDLINIGGKFVDKMFSMRNQVTYTGLTVVNLHVPVVPMCLCPFFPTVLPLILATVLKFALPNSHPPNKKN